MVLVTGGTGLVGAHLLLHLIRNQTAVRAIYRKGSSLSEVEKVFSYYSEDAKTLFSKIEWVLADLSDLPGLEKAFEEIEYVYHAAALISFDPARYQQLVQTNAVGTANIVNLCISHKIEKLCYVSTIGTIGRSSKGTLADEETDWSFRNVNVYAKSKYAAEIEVWRGSQEGLKVVIVNPGVILGPGFWHSGSGSLFKTANKGYRFYPPGGTGFITIHDVIRIMTALMHSSIQNERFIAVAVNLSFQEILSRIAPKLGKEVPNKKLAYWQLEIGRLADTARSFISGKERQITKNSIHSMKYRSDYSNKKIVKALNIEFEALDKVIDFCCARFIEENL